MEAPETVIAYQTERCGIHGQFERKYLPEAWFYLSDRKAYYAIGANIFAQITDSAEIDNMELLSNALNKNNERQISKYLDKVIRIADTHRVDAREHLKQQERLYAFIDELEKSNPEGYMSLQKQFAQFEELFDRYSKYGVTIQSNAN